MRMSLMMLPDGALAGRAHRGLDRGPGAVREVLVEVLVVGHRGQGGEVLPHHAELALLPAGAELVLLHGGPVRIDHARLHHPADGLERLQEFGLAGVDAEGGLGLHVPEAADPVGAEERVEAVAEAGLVQLPLVDVGPEAVRVGLAVAVRVPLGERPGHREELVDGPGRLEAEPVQPVLADHQAFPLGDGAHLGEAVHAALHGHHLAADRVVVVALPVRHLGEQVVHRRQQPGLGQLEHRVGVHRQQVRQVVGRRGGVDPGVRVGEVGGQEGHLELDAELLADHLVPDPVGGGRAGLAHRGGDPDVQLHRPRRPGGAASCCPVASAGPAARTRASRAAASQRSVLASS